jgi:hypothetical protein
MFMEKIVKISRKKILAAKGAKILRQQYGTN